MGSSIQVDPGIPWSLAQCDPPLGNAVGPFIVVEILLPGRIRLRGPIRKRDNYLDPPVRPPIVITDDFTRGRTEHSTVLAQPRLSIHLHVSRILGCGDADPLRRDS